MLIELLQSFLLRLPLLQLHTEVSVVESCDAVRAACICCKPSDLLPVLCQHNAECACECALSLPPWTAPACAVYAVFWLPPAQKHQTLGKADWLLDVKIGFYVMNGLSRTLCMQ